MKVAGRGVEMTWGEAEWAATQTLHFADSIALEWWCAAKASADQNVSTRHSNAMLFDVDRTSGTPHPRAGIVRWNTNLG